MHTRTIHILQSTYEDLSNSFRATPRSVRFRPIISGTCYTPRREVLPPLRLIRDVGVSIRSISVWAGLFSPLKIGPVIRRNRGGLASQTKKTQCGSEALNKYHHVGLLLWEVIVNVIQDISQKSSPLGAKGTFGQRVRQVLIGTTMSQSGFAHCHRFTDSMIANRVRFLLQGQLGYGGIGHLGFVIPVDETGAGQGHTHHTELISQSPQRFDPMLHGDEFCAEDGSLNSRLPLGDLLDKSQVAVDQDTGARTSSTLATGMVTVAHHA